MSTFYITFINLYNENNKGIHQKIISQCRVLKRKLSKNTFYTSRVFETAILFCDGKIIKREPANDRRRYCDVILKWMREYQAELIYSRYHFSDVILSDFFKDVKKMGLPIIIEIPTYPYDGELKEGLRKYEDTTYRESLIKYADIISTYSEDSVIWNKHCINLVNGIDSLNICDKFGSIEKKGIFLISVLSMNTWHGLERLIKGFYNYYCSKKNHDPEIYLIAIGDGPERGNYEALSNRYGLKDYISFVGAINHDELNDYYLKSDIAVDALGLYKKGMDKACSIKGAEYCAKGMPIVSGYVDLRFPDDLQFVYHVPNDETPVNMFGVVDWFKDLSKDKEYKINISNYAKENLTWDSIMQPVVDYYKTVCDKN